MIGIIDEKLKSVRSHLGFHTESGFRFTDGMLGSSLATRELKKKYLGPSRHPTGFMLRRYFRYVFNVQTPNSASPPVATAQSNIGNMMNLEKNEVCALISTLTPMASFELAVVIGMAIAG